MANVIDAEPYWPRCRVQDYIAAGQFRDGEQLIDVQNAARPGTLLRIQALLLPIKTLVLSGH